jgi:hypothetical protein
VSMRKNLNLTDFVFSRKYKPVMATMAALGLLYAAPALAANPSAPSPSPGASSADPFKDLKSMERRFFFHEYDHDPLEKRLERIELLVFGSAQDGKNTDRLGRIRSAVVARDKEAAQHLAEKNRAIKAQPAAPAAPKATSPASSSQYPVLQTLEWRALQKTYSGETLDQRLDRLETTLLGQPSPAMSYSDRIERLKKMIGVETSSGAAPKSTQIPQGPTPRALGRRQMSPFNSPYITPLPRGFDDNDDDDTTFEQDFHNQMSNDLRTMMEMMQRMNRAPGFRMPGGRGLVLPTPGGEDMTPYLVPTQPVQPKKPKIPPYADPNSI